MTKPKLDKESPSLTPHGDVIRTPGGSDKSDKPGDKGIDAPAEPGRPTPSPSSPGQPSTKPPKN